MACCGRYNAHRVPFGEGSSEDGLRTSVGEFVSRHMYVFSEWEVVVGALRQFGGATCGHLAGHAFQQYPQILTLGVHDGRRSPATALQNSSPPLFIFNKKQNDAEFEDVGNMEPITSTLVRTLHIRKTLHLQ